MVVLLDLHIPGSGGECVSRALRSGGFDSVVCRSLDELAQAITKADAKADRQYMRLVMGPWIESSLEGLESLIQRHRRRVAVYSVIRCPHRHALHTGTVHNSQCAQLLQYGSDSACRALWARMAALLDWVGASELPHATLSWLTRVTTVRLVNTKCSESDSLSTPLVNALSAESVKESVLSGQAADWWMYRRARRDGKQIPQTSPHS